MTRHIDVSRLLLLIVIERGEIAIDMLFDQKHFPLWVEIYFHSMHALLIALDVMLT